MITVLAFIRAGRWGRWARYGLEWALIVGAACVYSGQVTLNLDPQVLQISGEHNESATLPLLAEIGLRRYGEIPLWNPYMLTGFPHVGDLVNHFWHPSATLPVWFLGGINGLKISVLLAFIFAGLGQWALAQVLGARGLVRVWAALMYMFSGGLAMLWRVGWYELLLGAAWFPACFAALWWALQRPDRASLIVTAVCVSMVLTTGGGYYPFYLFVSLSVLTGVAGVAVRAGERRTRWARALWVAGLSAGLTAVMLLPILDGYRLSIRDVGPDFAQNFSQPITYALLNYVVSAPDWFHATILGTAGGWNWFYIGPLPVALLGLVPLVFSQWRRRRVIVVAFSALCLVLLAWHANRYTPVRYIYDWLPFLYNLRFPNRLLIIIASPLIALAALGLHYLFIMARVWGRSLSFSLANREGQRVINFVSVKYLLYSLWLVPMLWSLQDVYRVNQSVAFAARPLNAKAWAGLRWLKAYDPGLYYTQLGDPIYWDWAPAAYDLEMPVINFQYGRHLATQDEQHAPGAPFFARPKYLFVVPDQPHPAQAELLQDFDGVGLWAIPDALPFAFSAPPALLQPYATLSPEAASPVTARWDGPNRVVVRGQPARAGDQLVVLVSHYPGWRLTVDDQPAPVVSANNYLGAAMPPGEHTYVFVFSPWQHWVGLGVSLLTLLGCLLGLGADARAGWRARRVV